MPWLGFRLVTVYAVAVHTDLLEPVGATVLVVLPAVLVGGLFLWTARKDDEEDKALQARGR